MIVETFDLEFKIWLEKNGINIDSSIFELKFNSPQNFAAYRQSELDTARVGVFSQLQEIPFLSRRFAMKRFLGLTQEEISENETMWREENGNNLKPITDASGQLRGVGVTPSAMAGEMADQTAEMPVGAEGEAGMGVAATPGGAPAASAGSGIAAPAPETGQ